MEKYPKIQSVFKRDEKGRFLMGQYATPEIELLRDVEDWRWTEKVDGTNIRVHYDAEAGTVHLGGGTDNAQLFAPLVARLQELFPVEKFATQGLPTLTLYGEGYGAKIQKGGGNYIPDGVDFVLFDVRIGNYWLSDENMRDVASKLEIRAVEDVQVISIEGILEHMTHENRVQAISRLSPNAKMEGFVGKPVVDLFNRKGERIITKIKYKDFK